MLPRVMNLCLSNLCDASCVFCPRRANGVPSETPMMSLNVAVRAIGQARANNIRDFGSVSENGDCWCNQQAVEILRVLRALIPDARVQVFTNFLRMTPALTDVLLAEGLVNRVTMNMDGLGAEYERTRGIPYETVRKHLLHFLSKRGDRRLPLSMRILSLKRYCDAMTRWFGRLPPGLPVVEHEDAGAVIREWKKFLDLTQDDICFSPALACCHRDLATGDQAKYECPNLGRVENECFIAPNGDWYACCAMTRQNVTFGNIVEKSLSEMAESPERARFIAALRLHRYSEIGYPCDTVQACQCVETK